MAGEHNFVIEFLHDYIQDDNEVDEKFACPKCGNRNTDTLEIDEQVNCNTDKDLVTCCECVNKYEV